MAPKHKGFADRIYRGAILSPPKREPKIILARHIPLEMPATALTFESCADLYAQGEGSSQIPFNDLVKHSWVVMAFLDSLTVELDDENQYTRHFPAPMDSEFDGAEVCARWSTILYSAALLARDFPPDITGIELRAICDDYINRMTKGGVGDRFLPSQNLRAGWEERIAPFGYQFVFVATTIARALASMIHNAAAHWLPIADENEILMSLHPTTF